MCTVRFLSHWYPISSSYNTIFFSLWCFGSLLTISSDVSSKTLIPWSHISSFFRLRSLLISYCCIHFAASSRHPHKTFCQFLRIRHVCDILFFYGRSLFGFVGLMHVRWVKYVPGCMFMVSELELGGEVYLWFSNSLNLRSVILRFVDSFVLSSSHTLKSL